MQTRTKGFVVPVGFRHYVRVIVGVMVRKVIFDWLFKS